MAEGVPRQNRPENRANRRRIAQELLNAFLWPAQVLRANIPSQREDYLGRKAFPNRKESRGKEQNRNQEYESQISEDVRETQKGGHRPAEFR